jgi:NodT family efflux transporter outer membrane factor (OMF) lipoprotein
MIRLIMLSLFIFITSGCAVGPDYSKPDMGAPDKFVLQDVLKKLHQKENEPYISETEDIYLNWWEGYTDPILNTLVNEGLENNYNIAEASARLKEAYAVLNLASSDDDITAIAAVNPNVEEEIDLENRDKSDTDANVLGLLSVVLPLDIFGRTARREEAAMAQIEGASAELRGTILTVSSDIVSRYLRLRGDQRQLELLEESVELQDKTLSIVRSRYKAGLSPELDVRRAEATVENLRADVPGLKESIVNSRNALATLAGRYPGAYEELLSEDREIPEYRGVIPELVPVDVLTMRPDVQQAEADLKRRMAEIGIAKAEFYPSFQLAGQISIGSSGLIGESTMNMLIGRLAALIEQVVLDGGARQANLDIAKAGAEEALAIYRQTLLNATRDVEETLAALESSHERQKSLEKAVNASERSFHQAGILYQQGLTSFLDVVDSQRVLANAQQDLASARTDYSSQIANLFRVLGTTINTDPKKS